VVARLVAFLVVLSIVPGAAVIALLGEAGATWDDWIPLVNTALITVGFVSFGIFILVREKSWIGPSQHGRIRDLEDGHAAVLKRLGRLEDNFQRLTDENHETNRTILRELQTLRELKTADVSDLRQELDSMKDAVSKVDQDLSQAIAKVDADLSGLPCYQMALAEKRRSAEAAETTEGDGR